MLKVHLKKKKKNPVLSYNIIYNSDIINEIKKLLMSAKRECFLKTLKYTF